MFRLSIAILALTAAAAAAQEREWIFDTSDEQAFLTFGVPESEDAGISFWCALGSGEIKIFIPEGRESLKPGTKAPVILRAGGKEFPFEAEVTPNEMSGIPSVEAEAPTGDPLFAMLQASDRFGVVIGGEEDMFPLTGSDFEGLLRACGKRAQ